MSGFRPRFFIAEDHPGSLVPPEGEEGVELTLAPGDSHHAVRVLRLKKDDPCEVVVGGAVYAASVVETIEPARVRLQERLEGQDAGAIYRVQVGLVQALTRPALLDHVLEKGTEVGTSFFILVPTAGSTQIADMTKPSRRERWQRIVLEAAKQSKQSRVPSVDLVESFEAALDRLASQGAISVALEPSGSTSLAKALARAGVSRCAGAGSVAGTGTAANGIALWVGPESGWSDDELDGLEAAGIGRARMGQSVLRAETAGPVAVAVTRLVIGDW